MYSHTCNCLIRIRIEGRVEDWGRGTSGDAKRDVLKSAAASEHWTAAEGGSFASLVYCFDATC